MTLNGMIFPENSPTMSNAATKNITCVILTAYCKETADTPITRPASSRDGEEPLASSVAAADSSLSEFRNIECKYRVDPRVIGAGINGSVRECTDRATGERYAVKSIRKWDPAVKPGDLAREIKLLKRLNHQNIIHLVDVCEDARCLHIITDLCAGGELFDKIVEKRAKSSGNGAPCLAEGEAAKILHQILTAVMYMHARGIVHRDLKPENILFDNADEDSPIKIIDFGLARKYSGNREDLPMSTIVGTPYYIAPEVLQKKYDKSCDLWSAGVIAYLLLCGYPPFNGATNQEVHESVQRGRCRFPPEDWSGTSTESRDFIRQLLRKDPRRRMTAKQALNHPWLVWYTNTDVVMCDEVRQDDSSVEVVFKGLSRRDPNIYVSSGKRQIKTSALR